MKTLFKIIFVSTLFLMLFSCGGLTCIDMNSNEKDYLDERNKILYYKGDVFNGCLTEYDENGQLKSKGNYKDGKLGELVVYYENGQILKKGNVKDGEKDGEWVHYHENGKIKYKRTLKDGVLIETIYE